MHIKMHTYMYNCNEYANTPSSFLSFFLLPAYYISYGPHGPRAPIVPPNTNGKVFLGVVASIVAAASIFGVVRMNCECLSKGTRLEKIPHLSSTIFFLLSLVILRPSTLIAEIVFFLLSFNYFSHTQLKKHQKLLQRNGRMLQQKLQRSKRWIRKLHSFSIHIYVVLAFASMLTPPILLSSDRTASIQTASLVLHEQMVLARDSRLFIQRHDFHLVNRAHVLYLPYPFDLLLPCQSSFDDARGWLPTTQRPVDSSSKDSIAENVMALAGEIMPLQQQHISSEA